MTILIAWWAVARAAEWDVGPSGYDFTSIASALSSASVQDGDTLWLYGSGWTDSITVTKDVTIDGINAAITLSSDSSSGFFEIDGAIVTVRNLTIDGNGTRALRVDNNGALTLDNVIVSDAERTDSSGAGIDVIGNSSLVVIGGTLINNHTRADEASPNGGAIAIEAGSSLDVSGTRFENNSADDGGAIWCEGTCTIEGSTFINNESTNGDGGAILFRSGGASRHNLFCNNTANQRGGAVGFVGSGAIDVGFNVYWGNYADQDGGALWSSRTLTSYNNDFIGNSSNQQGAAIYVTGGAVNIINSIATDHTAGGELFRKSNPGSLTVRNLLHNNNAIGLTGGGANTAGTVINGDPLFVYRHPTDCEQSDLHLSFGSPAIGQGDPVYSNDLGAFPCGVEIAGDGIDQDCDGVDLCYEDIDGDGYGGAPVPGIDLDCTGFVTNDLDCNDNNPAAFPGADEFPADGSDSDCDGTELCYDDNDGDGVGSTDLTLSSDVYCAGPGVSLFNNDCNDNNALESPLITEIGCDSIDNDCDVLTPDSGDNDGDTVDICAGDCDDNNPEIYPTAIEICDGLDNDCSGSIDDDAVDASSWYPDTDGDGYGDGTPVIACTAPPDHASLSGDCDESSPLVNPGAPEQCNNAIDDDCDGDNTDYVYTDWFVDADGDGYGDTTTGVYTCAPDPGMVFSGGDCNDNDTSIYPGAADLCEDGIDQDCNGTVDDGPFDNTWYEDADGDGYGNLDSTLLACIAPDGWVALPNDCDDTDNTIHPGATESCDGIDQDCNNTIDDIAGTISVWPDSDGDGYGDAQSEPETTCLPGFVENNGDCDDSTPTIHPGLEDDCDGLDNDCDGIIDPSCDRAPESKPIITQPIGCGCNQGTPASAWLLLPAVLLLRRRI